MGPFKPMLGPEYYGPYQNYEVTIPASTPAGKANLAAADFYLVGVSFYTLLDCLEVVFLTSALVGWSTAFNGICQCKCDHRLNY